MRTGGGKNKGSEWEREVGKRLSRWISKGARSDLFTRNVLSGGDFTRRIVKESGEIGTPGDLMARDKLAFDFIRAFFVECKHYKVLGFVPFLFDVSGKTFLSVALAHASMQAAQSGTHFMFVAKQNNLQPVVILNKKLAELLYPAANTPLHIIHQRYVLTTLAHIESLDADSFIDAAQHMLRIKQRLITKEV